MKHTDDVAFIRIVRAAVVLSDGRCAMTKALKRLVDMVEARDPALAKQTRP